MLLFLVRHAIAEERDLDRWPTDEDRPLSPTGSSRFVPAAQGLVRLGPAPQLVLTSPLLRARQTADLLHEAGWPSPRELDGLAPAGKPEEVSAAIERFPVERLALVGHEPNLGSLMSWLLTGDLAVASIFKKGGAALLSCPQGPRDGGAELLAFLPPRALRSLSR